MRFAVQQGTGNRAELLLSSCGWVRNGIRIQDFYVPGACSFISCPSSLNNRSQSERANVTGAADGPTVGGGPRYQLKEHRQQEPTWPPLTCVQRPRCPSAALEENWHFEAPQCQHPCHGGGLLPAFLSGWGPKEPTPSLLSKKSVFGRLPGEEYSRWENSFIS